MLDIYLDTRTSGQGKQIKPKTSEGYEWLRDTVLADWHSKPLKQITEEFVISLHGKITKDRGPVCANNALRFVRASLNFGDVVPNPVHVLSRKHLWNPEKKRKGFIKKFGVAAWIEQAELLDGWMKGAVLMLLFLGLRKNEVLTLKQSQIKDRCVVLMEGETKNSDEHIVPMGPYLWERIKPLLDGSEYVFQSRRSEVGHIVDVRKSLAKLGEDITVHDLRRTFVSHLNALEPAPSKYTIKRLMNHRAREDVTDDYIQIEITTLRAVITRLETEMVGTSSTK
jgi:integrase